jgi:hypothetical protein
MIIKGKRTTSFFEIAMSTHKTNNVAKSCSIKNDLRIVLIIVVVVCGDVEVGVVCVIIIYRSSIRFD